MLEETFHCDGPGCENTTPKKSPGSMWRVTMWLRAHVTNTHEPFDTADTRENHYCSWMCEYNHAHIRAFPDAGK